MAKFGTKPLSISYTYPNVIIEPNNILNSHFLTYRLIYLCYNSYYIINILIIEGLNNKLLKKFYL